MPAKAKARRILADVLKAAHELSEHALATYARLYQLELWLRRMVYVELKAAYALEWKNRCQENRAQHSRDADLYLTHMPTREAEVTSYLTFGDLCGVIDKERALFARYLPPRELWLAKLEEVRQIRNRVAHFREGHHDDLRRVEQFLRDLDKGFFLFCSSYNDGQPIIPASSDSVANEFIHLCQFPYTHVGENRWARVGVADPSATFDVGVKYLRRPWVENDSEIAGSRGFIYDIRFTGRKEYEIDHERLLKDSHAFHEFAIHVVIDTMPSSIRVTIPAVLGSDKVIEVISGFLKWLPNSIRRGPTRPDQNSPDYLDQLAGKWPEYVIPSTNALGFLDPEMPCSFFGA